MMSQEFSQGNSFFRRKLVWKRDDLNWKAVPELLAEIQKVDWSINV